MLRTTYVIKREENVLRAELSAGGIGTFGRPVRFEVVFRQESPPRFYIEPLWEFAQFKKDYLKLFDRDPKKEVFLGKCIREEPGNYTLDISIARSGKQNWVVLSVLEYDERRFGYKTRLTMELRRQELENIFEHATKFG